MARAGLEQRIQPLANGGQLAYWTGGVGRPLLLLGGFGADALWQWFAVAPTLARSHRLFIPDLLYFGQSRGGSRAPSLEGQVDAIRELLDAQLAVGRRVDAAGLSYGGLVVWALAAQQPERVDRLVLIGTPGDVFGADDLAALHQRFSIDHPADLLLPTDVEGMRRLLAVGFHRPPAVPSFILRDVHRLHYQDQIAEKRSLIDDLLARLGGDVPAIDCARHQSLLIWGRHDAIFPLEVGDRLRHRLGSHATLHVVEDTAHAPPQERPRAVLAAMGRFLQD